MACAWRFMNNSFRTIHLMIFQQATSYIFPKRVCQCGSWATKKVRTEFENSFGFMAHVSTTSLGHLPWAFEKLGCVDWPYVGMFVMKLCIYVSTRFLLVSDPRVAPRRGRQLNIRKHPLVKSVIEKAIFLFCTACIISMKPTWAKRVMMTTLLLRSSNMSILVSVSLNHFWRQTVQGCKY